jgi:hypothetical protein
LGGEIQTELEIKKSMEKKGRKAHRHTKTTTKIIHKQWQRYRGQFKPWQRHTGQNKANRKDDTKHNNNTTNKKH